MRINLFLITSVLVAGMMVIPASGCEDETTKTASVAAGSSTAGAETPVPAPKPEPGQPLSEEQPSPYGTGSTSSQAVGTLIDGMQLMNVRWGDHGGYFRVVFDMGTPDGEPVLQVPHAETSLSPDGKTVQVVLSGIRSIGTSPNAGATDMYVGNGLVTSIRRIPSMDDQALIYEISLAQPATYSLAGLGSPGRIVIDITRPQA